MTSPWAALNEFDPDLHGAPEQLPPAAQRSMAVWITLAIVLLPLLYVLL
jgi:hypothetical protein